jgi:transcription antitermination protein NusB
MMTNKLLRRQGRVLAIQALYEWDISQHDPMIAIERLVSDEDATTEAADHARQIIQVVLAHIEVIDEKLAQAAFHRPLSQMASVEKSILRLAICEILFDNAVPAPAAINEAVEIAKTYGGDNSGRFINGVLGTIINQSV